jgi:hypothetical protein
MCGLPKDGGEICGQLVEGKCWTNELVCSPGMLLRQSKDIGSSLPYVRYDGGCVLLLRVSGS